MSLALLLSQHERLRSLIVKYRYSHIENTQSLEKQFFSYELGSRVIDVPVGFSDQQSVKAENPMVERLKNESDFKMMHRLAAEVNGYIGASSELRENLYLIQLPTAGTPFGWLNRLLSSPGLLELFNLTDNSAAYRRAYDMVQRNIIWLKEVSEVREETP